MKVSILGLGYIGLPTGVVIANAGHDVFGFDVNKKVIDTLRSAKIHIVEKDLQEAYTKVLESGRFKASDELQIADIYVIAVPTPFKESSVGKQVDLSYVLSATESVAKILKKGDLVILESTSPPGTTQLVTEKLVELSGLAREDFHTAHCPERVLPGNILYELLNNDRVIGSEKKESGQMAKTFYESFMTGGTVYLTNDITAEMCKLVENTSRDIDIAFANELSMMCDELGIDVFELIELANKHPRVDILSPGVGVGGHCIAIDPWFLIERFPKTTKVVRAARERNDSKPIWVAEKADQILGQDKTKKIGVLGLAYKANVDDLRESPSIHLAHKLQEMGYEVCGCEPYSKESKIQGIPNLPLREILDKADYFILTLAHTEFIDEKDLIFSKRLLNVVGI